ncbi:hypothetical protein SAMN06265222_1253 [Neorhodopirellula lusitana]|uniref:Uncharacterized protein n=1 Tax=Neorhodopirellula lusitana TaxID=445327 RepID=A0ABY1QT41_9BACT|nr:hypothetical protein SAMN06265222_1253 [Neorhodopirellula lusitana]
MLTALLILLACLAPIHACYLVIDLLVGIERLTNHYWVRDGVIISIGLNLLGLVFSRFRRVRKHPAWSGLVWIGVVSLATFLCYGFFMLAIISV